MSRGTLKFLAGFLGILIVCVLLAGFDNLPRGVRAEIDSERRAFTDAQKQLQGSQAEVNRDLAAEADLFRAVPASQQWPGAWASLPLTQAAPKQRVRFHPARRRK